MPPKPPLRPPRPIQSGHLKEKCLGPRLFQWETVKQLFEEYYLDAVRMNDVLRPGDEHHPDSYMVLQFQQGACFYRMAFEPIMNEFRPDLPPVEARIITMFHDGFNPGLPACPVQLLDGTFDLPEENIP